MNDNPEVETNPLLFWVAYLPGEGEKKKYLSNGHGGLRLFKSEIAIHEYLTGNLTPEVLERIVVHSIQGMIAVPQEEEIGIGGTLKTDEALKPIGTLAVDGAPTAHEVLTDYIKRNKRRRARK